MCTIVARKDGQGRLWLVGNRDEAIWRGRAEPPAIRQDGTVLAPRDVDAGGTWTLVNRAGLAVTLLNDYEAEAAFRTPPEPISRGTLVAEVGATGDLATAEAAVRAAPLPHIRPFRLLAVDAAGADALEARWDGEALTIAHPPLPLWRTSAGHDLAAATAARAAVAAQTLDALPPDADSAATEAAIAAFLTSHSPAKGGLSACKHTAIANTVSQTWITVDPVASPRVAMAYVDGPPCEHARGDWLVLPADGPSPQGVSES